MKRINILLGKRIVLTILAYIAAFTFGIPLLIGCLPMIIGASFCPVGFWGHAVLFLIGAYSCLLEYRYHPFYLEYDDEKIIAHYLLGITATVWKNKDIYKGVFYPNKGIPLLIFSNTPFPVSLAKPGHPLGCSTKLSVNEPDTSTQITLPIQASPEMLGLFPSKTH